MSPLDRATKLPYPRPLTTPAGYHTPIQPFFRSSSRSVMTHGRDDRTTRLRSIPSRDVAMALAMFCSCPSATKASIQFALLFLHGHVLRRRLSSSCTNSRPPSSCRFSTAPPTNSPAISESIIAAPTALFLTTSLDVSLRDRDTNLLTPDNHSETLRLMLMTDSNLSYDREGNRCASVLSFDLEHDDDKEHWAVFVLTA